MTKIETYLTDRLEQRTQCRRVRSCATESDGQLGDASFEPLVERVVGRHAEHGRLAGPTHAVHYKRFGRRARHVLLETLQLLGPAEKYIAVVLTLVKMLQKFCHDPTVGAGVLVSHGSVDELQNVVKEMVDELI